MTPPDFIDPNASKLDPNFQSAVQRLHQLTVLGRWLVVLGMWLSIGALSLWGLSYPISLMRDYFTWSALRHGLANNLLATVGLALCIGMTLSVLVWQSRNIVFGLPKDERERLERMVLKIRQQGKSHPLWKWIEPKS
ncbi:MAG: hypothetical protein MUC48_19355 [Leptolyngbya sp. Prado105]|jgi:hypothetical protein|nr:hypothetical protein [Leptolyngbya sp. Prado105]